MTATLKRIAGDLMTLEPEDRIELAEVLIASVPAFATEGTAKAWDKEIDRRLDEYEAGQAKVVSAEQSFARARKALREAHRTPHRRRC